MTTPEDNSPPSPDAEREEPNTVKPAPPNPEPPLSYDQPIVSPEGSDRYGHTVPLYAGAAVPEDLRTPWSWPDLILFLLFILGSSVVLPLLAGMVAILWGGVKPVDIDRVPGTKAAILLAGQALWSVATMLYLFGTVRLRTRRPFWSTIGWRELRPHRFTRRTAALLYVLAGIGLAVIVQLSSLLVGKKTRLPIEELFRNRPTVLMLMVLGIFVAPLVEETIFRGYIYPVLARGFGIPAGILVTGMLFGLAHAAQLWGGWGQIGLIIIVGIVLTSVRAQTGTVVASFLVHISYNTMLFFEFYLATGGLRRFPGA